MEREILRSYGHEISEFVCHSDEFRNKGLLKLLKTAIQVPWNLRMRNKLTKLVEEFDPDIIHVHNTFPMISPSIFYGIKGRAAVVLTLHNYRLFCPAAIPLRDGQICTECLDRYSALPAITHGCYKHSRIATLPIALNVALHRWLKTWKSKVDAFITLSEFQKKKLSSAGLPLPKVYVKPNFYANSFLPLPWSDRGAYVTFVGRLSQEKGIFSLLMGWKNWYEIDKNIPELRIVGDGPLKQKLEQLAINLPIRFFGQVSSEEAQNQIANARLLILPSECYEGFPMVIAEAFALGTPVAASNLGPLPFIVENKINGVLFEPNNYSSLRLAIESVWKSPVKLKQMGIQARKSFEQKYTADINYQILTNIYAAALKNKRNKK